MEARSADETGEKEKKVDGARSVRWIHETRVDGVVTFRRGKRGDRLVADWPGFARLTCARDGSDVRLVPAAGVPRSAVEGLRGAPIRALLHDLAGCLSLHASAVDVGGRAVMFVGEGGSGKSTAAAELCLRNGAALLADDAALLDLEGEKILVLPAAGRHSLTRDSCRALGVPAARAGARRKKEVRAARIAAAPRPLALVVALSFSRALASAEVRPMRGGEAARALLGATIRFDVEDAAARQREFEQLTTVHERTQFLAIRRPAGDPGPVGPFVVDALEKGAS